MKLAIAAALLPLAAAHSSLITPKPRNAIDSELPEWADGNAPYMWVPNIGKDGTPCACRNGSQPCESAQTCLWFVSAAAPFASSVGAPKKRLHRVWAAPSAVRPATAARRVRPTRIESTAAAPE